MCQGHWLLVSGPVPPSLHGGDVLVVAKLDRLSRSVWGFTNLLRQRRARAGRWAARSRSST
jgi:hypothetical protein